MSCFWCSPGGCTGRGLFGQYTQSTTITLLPPNMAALLGPAIGARNSRQEDFGYTALRALAQHKIIKTFILSIPLILLYLLSGGRLTGPTMATPANLPSGKAGCTALPTNLPTKPIPASRDAKYAQRGPLVHITHNTQLTSSNKTIDEHPAQIWTSRHLQRQDQIRNYPKHTPQHIIHKNISDKNYKPPRHTQFPETWSSRQNNQFKLAQIWTSRHSWQEIIQTYLKRKHQFITHKYLCNTNHKSTRTTSPLWRTPTRPCKLSLRTFAISYATMV